jgi:GNAT superfamily N-acetyltransferase
VARALLGASGDGAGDGGVRNAPRPGDGASSLRARIAVEDRVAPEDVAFIEERINEFNFDATGYRDGRELACILREDGGEIVAGLTGYTWGGYCRVSFLWVAEPYRRAGLGRALLHAAEDEARERGCALVHLDTHDFQAPRFYERLGYEAIGRCDDVPAGYGQTWYRKRLDR